MGNPLLSKEEVLDRLVQAFRRHGKEGTSISMLESATGLKRNSLYHLFPGGKDEMAAAVIEHATALMLQYVLEPLRLPGDPHQKLKAMCDALDGFYNSGREPCLVGVFSLGQPGDAIQAQIEHVVTLWIDALSKAIEREGISRKEARIRAQDAVINIQGALVVSRALGNGEPFKRLMRKMPDTLLDPE